MDSDVPFGYQDNSEGDYLTTPGIPGVKLGK